MNLCNKPDTINELDITDENSFANKLIVFGILQFWTIFAPIVSFITIFVGITYIKMNGLHILSGAVIALLGVMYGIIYILFVIRFAIISWRNYKTKKNKEKENKENKVNKEGE